MRHRTVAAAVGVGAAAAILGAGAAIAGGALGGGPDEVLDQLVADGTLTQEQADRVGEAFRQHHEERRAQHEAMRAERQQLIADTIGISAEELEQRLADGETLGEIAGDSREELAAVLVDAMVAHLQERSGDALTEEQLAQMRLRAQERVEAMLDGEHHGPPGHRGGRGPGGFGGFGPKGGPFGGPTPDSEASGATETTSVRSPTV